MAERGEKIQWILSIRRIEKRPFIILLILSSSLLGGCCLKRFIRTLAVFLAPVAVLLGVLFAALWRTGELARMGDIESAMARGGTSLVGFAYRDNTRTLKQNVAAARGARVLVLGTSRAMQLRSGFFASDSFYNAGGGIAYISQALPFLERLPDEARPTSLVLVLDQYFYNPQWCSIEPEESLILPDYAPPAPLYAFRHMLWDFADGKFSLWRALTTPQGVYGLAAVGRGSGFLADGSYYYGDVLFHPERSEDAGFHDTFDRITRQTGRFEPGDTPDAESLAETQALLSFCSENGISVTAFLPPYAPSVWRRMQETGSYTYIPAAVSALQSLFAQYGYELFDYTFLPETDDSQYVDGFHGSDRVYAAVCARLAEDSALLSGQFDKEALQSLFTAPGNPLTLPESS